MRTIVSRATDCQHGRPGVPQARRSIGTPSFDRLLAMYRAGPDELRAFVGPGPLLTDDRPLVGTS